MTIRTCLPLWSLFPLHFFHLYFSVYCSVSCLFLVHCFAQLLTSLFIFLLASSLIYHHHHHPYFVSITPSSTSPHSHFLTIPFHLHNPSLSFFTSAHLPSSSPSRSQYPHLFPISVLFSIHTQCLYHPHPINFIIPILSHFHPRFPFILPLSSSSLFPCPIPCHPNPMTIPLGASPIWT